METLFVQTNTLQEVEIHSYSFSRTKIKTDAELPDTKRQTSIACFLSGLLVFPSLWIDATTRSNSRPWISVEK